MLPYHGSIRKSSILYWAETCVVLTQKTNMGIQASEGYIFELARRFRSLGSMSIGNYYNQRTRKVHRVYRDLTPKATEALGRLLMEGYSTFTALILKQERARAKRPDDAEQLLKEGFAGIASIPTED